jgi:hypothetical protein
MPYGKGSYSMGKTEAVGKGKKSMKTMKKKPMSFGFGKKEY